MKTGWGGFEIVISVRKVTSTKTIIKTTAHKVQVLKVLMILCENVNTIKVKLNCHFLQNLLPVINVIAPCIAIIYVYFD